MELNGYIIGGFYIIGMKKKYPINIDETCFLYDFTFISAGIRGLQIKINPNDLIPYIECDVADII